MTYCICVMTVPFMWALVKIGSFYSLFVKDTEENEKHISY